MADGRIEYEVRANTDNLDSDLNQANSKAEGAASKLGGIAKNAAIGIGTAFVAAGAATIKFGSDFEREIKNLAAITGMSTDEIERMEDGIRKVALESGRSVIEITSNAKMLAESGGDIDLMMEQLAHGTNLATATQTDMATTLDFLGSAMKTFGIEADGTQGVVDSFAAVTTMANLELSQLSESYVNVGGAAANAGLSIDDTNAILVTFSNAGLKGGAAGTALNGVIKNLSTPTEKASEALNDLGVALYDNEGASRNMFDIMQELEGSLSNLSDEQRNRYESVIFDSVAQKGWNMIAAEGMDSIMGLSEELALSGEAFDGLGQAAGMAAVQGEGFQAMLDKVKGQLVDMAIEMYSQVQEPLKNAMDGISESLVGLAESGALEKFGAAIGEVGAILAESIVELLPVAIELLTGLVPPIAELISNFLPPLIELFSKFIPPIVEIIDKLMPILIKLFETLIPPLLEIIDMLLPPLLELIDALLPILDILIELLNPILELFVALLEPIISLISGAITPLINIILELIKMCIEPLKNQLNMLKEVFSAVLTSIANYVNEQIGRVKNIFDNLISFIKNVFTGNWKGAWENVKNIFQSIADGIAAAFKAPINYIIDAINGFIRGLSNIKIPNWVPLVGGKGFHISEIPRLKVGMDYVPSDDFPALLHKGESVLTAEQADIWRGIGGVNGVENLLSIQSNVDGSYKDALAGLVNTLGTGTNIENQTLFGKVADTLEIREDADIDKIVNGLYQKIQKAARNKGGTL